MKLTYVTIGFLIFMGTILFLAAAMLAAFVLNPAGKGAWFLVVLVAFLIGCDSLIFGIVSDLEGSQ